MFYDRLQSVLIEGGFDAFTEASCRPYYAARMGAPSVPPGRYFRMHLVGYFEGIDSERGLEWRCSDSLSLRAFLRLGSRPRRLPHRRMRGPIWSERALGRVVVGAVQRLPHELVEVVGAVFAAPRVLGVYHEPALRVAARLEPGRLPLHRRHVLRPHDLAVLVHLQ